jgi:hypothetical protein
MRLISLVFTVASSATAKAVDVKPDPTAARAPVAAVSFTNERRDIGLKLMISPLLYGITFPRFFKRVFNKRG